MGDLSNIPPAGTDPGPDPWKTIDRFKRAPGRAGCFGCMLTGWTAVIAGAAVLALLIYLVRRFIG
jgi:hypothetical protein